MHITRLGPVRAASAGSSSSSLLWTPPPRPCPPHTSPRADCSSRSAQDRMRCSGSGGLCNLASAVLCLTAHGLLTHGGAGTGESPAFHAHCLALSVSSSFSPSLSLSLLSLRPLSFFFLSLPVSLSLLLSHLPARFPSCVSSPLAHFLSCTPLLGGRRLERLLEEGLPSSQVFSPFKSQYEETFLTMKTVQQRS